MRSMNIVCLTVACLSVNRNVIWGSGVLDAGVFYISAELTEFGDIVVFAR